MLSDGALAVLAAHENANDEYQDTNDYWHDSYVEDVQPNKEDSEDCAAFVELASQRPGTSGEAEAAEQAEQYIAKNRELHKRIGLRPRHFKPVYKWTWRKWRMPSTLYLYLMCVNRSETS